MAYEMRISDWSSDVCSSDLATGGNASRISDAQRQQVTDKKEEYYQPWLRDPAPTPGAPRTDEGDEGLAKPKETPPVGLDLSRYPAAAEPKRPPLVETDRLRAGHASAWAELRGRPARRRVGKAGVSKFRPRGSPYTSTTNCVTPMTLAISNRHM